MAGDLKLIALQKNMIIMVTCYIELLRNNSVYINKMSLNMMDVLEIEFGIFFRYIPMCGSASFPRYSKFFRIRLVLKNISFF